MVWVALILKFGKDNGKYRGLHTFRCFSYEPLILLEKPPPTAYMCAIFSFGNLQARVSAVKFVSYPGESRLAMRTV
jgi:hypothetical protein